MRLSKDGRAPPLPLRRQQLPRLPAPPGARHPARRGQGSPDKGPRPDADLVRERGLMHERAFLETLRAEGHDRWSRSPRRASPRASARRLTEEAMRDGVEVIHQAGFHEDGWRGYADFVIRVERALELGRFSTRPTTQSSPPTRSPTSSSSSSSTPSRSARIQGRLPERMHLILGTQERPSFRTTDFTAYTARVRERYLAYLDELAAEARAALPLSGRALRLVRVVGALPRSPPGRRPSLPRRLPRARPGGEARGRRSLHGGRARGLCPTRRDGRPRCPAAPSLAYASRRAFRSRRASTGENVRELLEPEYGRGFARLPDASLRRRLLRHRGRPPTGARTASSTCSAPSPRTGPTRSSGPTTAHEERRMFEEWMDGMTERLAQHPDMHIYHYNSYETDRGQEADVALRHARARGRRAPSPRRLRRPLRGPSPGDADRQGELLAEVGRGLLRLRARRRGDRGRRLDARLPGVDRGAVGRQAPRDRRLQRRRLPLDAGPARLAARRARPRQSASSASRSPRSSRPSRGR